MNLLLYVKDPIYLYNILLYDLKIYIQNILAILDIIHKPDLHCDTYKTFIEFLLYKHNTFAADWTKPLIYKGWGFSLYNTNRPLIKQKNLDKINVNYFFSYATIIELNNSISNLDQYNGFFNLDNFNLNNISQNCLNFDTELNLLDLFNFNKLLYNFDFLFTINNIKGLRFYSLHEFMLYNELNNFEAISTCSNYNMFLIYMLKQNYKYNSLLKSDEIVSTQQNNKVKDYEDLIGLKKKKVIKRKSAPTLLKIKKRKTKIIKVLTKAILYPEDFKDNGDENQSEDDTQYQNDEYESGGVFYKYADLEVTDSESDTNLDVNNNNTILDTDTVVKKNILEIKADVISNVHKNFRQWASDLEFRKAYFNCKKKFNNILLDYTHPVWDEHRAYLKNEIIFAQYVKRLTDQDKEAIFNIFWDWTITDVLKKREAKYNAQIEKHWFNELSHATQQTDVMENIRSNELLNVFCTNLKKNEKWKKRWHHDMYFLDMYRDLPGKESHWRGVEYCKEGYFREPDLNERAKGSYEPNTFKKQEHQLELWDKTNWWKKW